MQNATLVPQFVRAGILMSLPLCLTAKDATNVTVAQENRKDRSYQYSVPEKTGDGWDTADLRSVGMDAGLISEFFNRLRAQFCTNMHSVLLVRTIKLVVEEYFSGSDENGKER